MSSRHSSGFPMAFGKRLSQCAALKLKENGIKAEKCMSQIRELKERLSVALSEKTDLATRLESADVELRLLREEAGARAAKISRLEFQIASLSTARGEDAVADARAATAAPSSRPPRDETIAEAFESNVSLAAARDDDDAAGSHVAANPARGGEGNENDATDVDTREEEGEEEKEKSVAANTGLEHQSSTPLAAGPESLNDEGHDSTMVAGDALHENSDMIMKPISSEGGSKKDNTNVGIQQEGEEAAVLESNKCLENSNRFLLDARPESFNDKGCDSVAVAGYALRDNLHIMSNPSPTEGGREMDTAGPDAQQDFFFAEASNDSLENPNTTPFVARPKSFSVEGCDTTLAAGDQSHDNSHTITNPLSSEGISEKDSTCLNSENKKSTLFVAGPESCIDEGCGGTLAAGDEVHCEAALFDTAQEKLKVRNQQREPQHQREDVAVPQKPWEETLNNFQKFNATKLTQDTDTVTDATTTVNDLSESTKKSDTSALSTRTEATKHTTDTSAAATDGISQNNNPSSLSSPTPTPDFAGNHGDHICLMSDSDSSSVPSSSSNSDLEKACNKISRRKTPGQSLQTNSSSRSKESQEPPYKKSAQSLQNSALQPPKHVPPAAVGPNVPIKSKILSTIESRDKVSARISVPAKPPPLLQASRKRPATSQIVSVVAKRPAPTQIASVVASSTRISVPSQPPPLLQASRKRPTTSQIATVVSRPAPIQVSSSASNDSSASLSRLWPDPSDIIKAITRWQPPKGVRKQSGGGKQTVEFFGQVQFQSSALGNERKNPLLLQPKARGVGRKRNVPKEFKDASEIMEAFGYPLMNEGLCSINGDYHVEKFRNGKWNRYSYHLKMTKLTEVSPILRLESYFCGGMKMYEAQLSARSKDDLPSLNSGELYCVYFQGWRECKFGITSHDFPTTEASRHDGKAVLKLWLIVHPNERDTEQTGWLSQNDLEKFLEPHKKGLVVTQNVFFTVMSCGPVTNIIRQFEAIKSLPYLKPHIQKALFAAFTADSEDSSKPASAKPRSMPVHIWRDIANSHNEYQLSSISRVLTGNCKENICLIQGPPGTGKSSTIAGLVSGLLSGKAPLPKQRQSGCLIHAGKEPPARNRILVCAATNQAVDSLAWKIKQESIGPSGKIGDFVMSRFGSLPWEVSRDSIDQKPAMLSDMEEFLYEINVDRRASDDIKNFEDDCGSQENAEERETKHKKRMKPAGRAKLRSQILGNSSIILTTLSSSGSKAFAEAVGRHSNKTDSEFDAVVIDEACQASEPESLIPFKYNPTTITLVGDPKQLPVLSLAGSSSYQKLFERSLFERLQSLNFPVILLRNQYRMHEDIASFPSEQFYKGKLITPDSVKNRSKSSWSCPCFPSLCFWDIRGRNMIANKNGQGFSNKEEATFITRTILCTLADTFLKKSESHVTVGIISFYRDQIKLLKEQLARIPALENSRLKVKVATVDGFQGSECDVIILSCVRSHPTSKKGRGWQRRGGEIGFLNDYRRVNVALTRAKCSLWIVGNAEVLKASDLWRKLIQKMEHQRVLHRGVEFKELFARWKASKE